MDSRRIDALAVALTACYYRMVNSQTHGSRQLFNAVNDAFVAEAHRAS